MQAGSMPFVPTPGGSEDVAWEALGPSGYQLRGLRPSV